MVQIKISYDHPHELDGILSILGPVIQRKKLDKEQRGPHKRAYVTIKDSAFKLTEANYRKLQKSL